MTPGVRNAGRERVDMKYKGGVLLFEVAFVMLLVSIISLFLFRGYSTFIKAGRKNSNCLKLILIAEEKIWDLELKEKNGQIANEPEKANSDMSLFRWQIND